MRRPQARAEALQADVQQAANLHSRGVAAARNGDPAHAITLIGQAITLNPRAAHFHSHLGDLLNEQGRLDEAAACYRQAISLNSDLEETHFNLGNLLRNEARLDEAAACYRRALSVKSDYPEAHLNLGITLGKQGQLDAAIACFRRAIELEPKAADPYNNLGIVLHHKGQLGAAITCFRRAIELDPNSASAHNNLGNALQELGALDAAYVAFEKAVAIAPRRGAFHRMLVTTGRVVPDSPQLRRLEALAMDMHSLPETERMEVHFALGMAYANFGQAEKSSPHLVEGNRLKRSRVRYDEAQSLAMFARIKEVFTAEMLNNRQERGPNSRVPIFVVGMPRSGTSLVEQILASDPSVHGAGELMALPRQVRRLLEHEPSAGAFPESAIALDHQRIILLGAEYLTGVQALAPSATHIVDKLPDNFRRIGLIHLALPGARIIHVHRDPIDTCLSCFAQLFTGDLPYTYNLAELGRYYRAYCDLMEHWRRVLPASAVLDVRYEDVVADLEGQARRLLAYCEIPWNDACLAFHRNRRVVRTASVTQVRRPLYASSVSRWHAFSDLAQPLLEALRGELLSSNCI